ncbi:TetR family transcriptional regulator [Nocardia sp. NBC_01503]|uniref:TetR/AcrR family transcriptional regulator n=1 Tax=Nocardia sp. NBC_01503 TaxID=2975997 RepID=UPI002E7B9F57|nr:TetR family transcriptional regulator [Nocardia sp. NBC_01503]WTL33298.1 TetR family transcriptional regulator [Nocardia sp. NBC_01503]
MARGSGASAGNPSAATEIATRDKSGRRAAICGAALDLAAAGGNRAITHHAIDDRLGIARGSTSYYYRTRQDLLRAALIHLASTSRTAFRIALESGDREAAAPPSVDATADLMAGQVDLLLGARRRDALARYALAADTAGDETLRTELASCLFSLPAATMLMESLGSADPERAARDLISLLEGLLFDRLHGHRSLLGIEAGTPASLADLRGPVQLWLSRAVR